MIIRTYNDVITRYLHKRRGIILFGARRTGKTTILNALAKEFEHNLYINCDLIDGQELFGFRNQQDIERSFGQYGYLLIDEAQRVHDIGIKLKAIIDTLPDLQIIATGSSAFELSNSTIEPLTGRKFEFIVTPLSTQEIYNHDGISAVKGGLHQRIIYGNYPEVYLDKTMPEEIIQEIAGSYLFKDILAYQEIRKPDVLKKLLQALALQVGNEVNNSELGQLVGIDPKTVDRYLNLLEKCFIIYRLGSYSNNLRIELKKSQKVFFWDNGIRNALINNFNPSNLRTDVGALWENYFITERRKMMLNSRKPFEHFFWRTKTQKEVDLIEVTGSGMNAFEVKWNPDSKATIPLTFKNTYPDAGLEVVTPSNYLDFLLDD